MLLVGSKALDFYGLARRKPTDQDYWGAEKIKGLDVTVMPQHIIKMVPTIDGVATPNAIYTIKCSHFGWDIHWEKTKLDILWLKHKGCVLIRPLFDVLVAHWKEANGNKEFLSLANNKKEFFNDYVTYVYDHDYLHELAAHPLRPAYEQCTSGEVLTSKDKFDMMPFPEQIRMFKEEIAVIAAERWLINPYWKGKVDIRKAWMLSLHKTITSLVKNWAQEFMVLNIEYFYKPDFDLLSKLPEIQMSNVDLTPFNALLNEFEDGDINELVFSLAQGDIDFIDLTPKNAPMSWKERHKVAKEILNRHQYKHLQQEGGGEGGAEHCEGVFQLGDKTYKVTYGYFSHHGYEYDYIVETLHEVKPVTKTITTYE